MAEDKKNTRKKPTNSSKLQNKTNLSNEELLEQILNKKKAKEKNKSK